MVRLIPVTFSKLRPPPCLLPPTSPKPETPEVRTRITEDCPCSGGSALKSQVLRGIGMFAGHWVPGRQYTAVLQASQAVGPISFLPLFSLMSGQVSGDLTLCLCVP